MIECFNSNWIILLSILISFIIIKKINNLIFNDNDDKNYINEKYKITEKMLPTITNYYIGLN
jgi:hypothetical protein